MNWQRFPGPRDSDDYDWCGRCGHKFHHTELNKFNHCCHCAMERVLREEPKEENKRNEND